MGEPCFDGERGREGGGGGGGVDRQLSHRFHLNLVDSPPWEDGLIELQHKPLIVVFIPDIAEAAKALEAAHAVLSATAKTNGISKLHVAGLRLRGLVNRRLQHAKQASFLQGDVQATFLIVVL